MGSAGLSPTAALESECAEHFHRGHAIALGRGTWALALALRGLEGRVSRKLLALPSFLCQTPLAGIHHAGWQPLFVDVDPQTGLVPDSEWAKAVELGAAALMPVHLFGNPADLEFATALCRERKVFLIEDACQAVGATIAERPCGAFGDASLLSFGHTKTIDVGSGGMLLTDDAALATAVRELAARQRYAAPAQHDARALEAARKFYERKDRLLANPGSEAAMLSGVIDDWLGLVPAPWAADAPGIARQLAVLRASAAERRRKFGLYAELLRDTGIVPLRMGAGAAPWRFCFRMPGLERGRQERIAAAMRARGLHISNWYVPTHWMASQTSRRTGALEGTLRLHAEIFQLWLDPATDDAQIRANAAAFRDVIAA
jgi:dTDP-4-amino-4,6-dideoxygalactose transaminase